MMDTSEIFRHLLTWTPYLLGGFAMNIWISIVAMVIGTGIGWILATLRLSSHPRRARASLVATEFSRSIPTIVFQFYLAFMLPSEILVPYFKHIIAFPVWIKAALALAIAVIGFTSDNLTIAMADWKKGDHHAAFLFIPSWTSYALIIVMASSTASIIGVSELLSRCNTVINATGNTQLMLPIYLYACLFFFCFCYPLTLLMKRISLRLRIRYGMTG
ncbi:polar amino acid ABC transporter permease [Undibacterium sp. TS12]|uniref:polar amino acid ABC transporter permease n=1 Tax=Undibacterium sp. TS12 TaxID=2908202 RepID=UPI001F4CBAE3|nr:polar amino acid ABC transporter permease [Undibacterium sp. TS12]MCH8621048.1 polar amino acid ABC transporter permease [Undibacterium sp. TS12]